MNLNKPFGDLPYIPNPLFHNQTSKKAIPGENYLFVLYGSGPNQKLRLQKAETTPPNGETDLGQIRNFVASHIEELPKEQLFIVDKINFLIEKHNQIAKSVKNYKTIELIPKSTQPLSFRQELEGRLETFFLEKKIPEEKQVAFWKQVEELLAESPKSKWDAIALLVEKTELFSDEEKTSLKHHLGTTFDLTNLPEELLLKISKETLLSFAGTSKRHQNIFLHPYNQEKLLKNFEQIRRIWPPFADETPVLEQNKAILAKIRELFSKDELKKILNNLQFDGSIEQIRAIDQAYQKQEEALVVLCEEIINQKQLPPLPGNSPSEKAIAARNWISDPNHQTILRSIRDLDLSNKGLSCIPKEIEKLSSLKHLLLDNNQISSLVGVTLPSSLDWLSLNNNQISSLVGATLPSSLESLYLNNNQISSLVGATLPSSLDWLSLGNNQISSLVEARLPSSLKLLWLNNNQISSLVGATLPSSLYWLSLSNNQISSLVEARLPSSLQELYLKENPLPPGATVLGLPNLSINYN